MTCATCGHGGVTEIIQSFKETESAGIQFCHMSGDTYEARQFTGLVKTETFIACAKCRMPLTNSRGQLQKRVRWGKCAQGLIERPMHEALEAFERLKAKNMKYTGLSGATNKDLEAASTRDTEQEISRKRRLYYQMVQNKNSL